LGINLAAQGLTEQREAAAAEQRDEQPRRDEPVPVHVQRNVAGDARRIALQLHQPHRPRPDVELEEANMALLPHDPGRSAAVVGDVAEVQDQLPLAAAADESRLGGRFRIADERPVGDEARHREPADSAGEHHRAEKEEEGRETALGFWKRDLEGPVRKGRIHGRLALKAGPP
jgi:hypothetical protein